MRRVALGLWCVCLLSAQPAAERPFKIVKLDPALDEIIAPDAKLETLGEHFGLSEGPVWVQHGADGYLLFSALQRPERYRGEIGWRDLFHGYHLGNARRGEKSRPRAAIQRILPD